MEFKHRSVLLEETVNGLNIRPDGIYVDGTLGGGGHAYEICRRLGDKGSIVGIDQDEAAIEAAGIRLKDFGEKVTIVRSNYCEMKSVLQGLGIDKVDGIVLDLGVSSYQLDTAERGFSYREDAPLDMRMDRRQTMTARDIVNDYGEKDRYRVIRDYGEDRFAQNRAKHKGARLHKLAPAVCAHQLFFWDQHGDHCLYSRGMEYAPHSADAQNDTGAPVWYRANPEKYGKHQCGNPNK